jgi:hypothetical protein
MSSLSAKDRASLCSFTFSDGRRCRTPRTGKNPRFCFYHAQKEARARAAETLGKDLAYFFSGRYLSACDLSTTLGRLIPAVIRGDVKPKTAHTVAYLAQTLMQAIHLSQHEYINAFGTDGWRKSIRTSVNGNRDYLFPPDPESQQSESPQPQPQRPPSRKPNPISPPQPHNRPHRHTLPCLPRAPNLFSVCWPVFRPIPSSLPNRLHRLRHLFSPTTDRGPAHPLRNRPQIGRPAHSTSTTTTASASTANPFRINTYTPARNC